MRFRSTAAIAVLCVGLSVPMIGTASAADRDCKDFASQADAQAALLPGDPERLDQNDNGIACEDFKYTTTGTTSGGSAVAAPAAVTPAAAPAATTPATSGTQVATRPVGAVAAGDGSTSSGNGALGYVLGGVALAGAGGAAAAARRSRASA